MCLAIILFVLDSAAIEGPYYFFRLYVLATIMRKPDFAYAKTKTQISFAVTAKLISAFVFATWIEQFIFFLNPKFQASNHIL